MLPKVSLCELARVEVPNGASQTLTQLGVILNPRAKSVWILNAGLNDVTINHNAAANANSFPLPPTAGIEIPGTITDLSRVQFYGNGADCVIGVHQKGD